MCDMIVLKFESDLHILGVGKCYLLREVPKFVTFLW